MPSSLYSASGSFRKSAANCVVQRVLRRPEDAGGREPGRDDVVDQRVRVVDAEPRQRDVEERTCVKSPPFSGLSTPRPAGCDRRRARSRLSPSSRACPRRPTRTLSAARALFVIAEQARVVVADASVDRDVWTHLPVSCAKTAKSLLLMFRSVPPSGFEDSVKNRAADCWNPYRVEVLVHDQRLVRVEEAGEILDVVGHL